MSCPRGKASPRAHTKLRLFADSGGYCQNPNCLRKLFEDTGTRNVHFAEMAHVFSAKDCGPRANKKLTPEERGDYSNLILLCANCHTIIDKAEEDFSDSLMLEWKKNHVEKIKQLFGVLKHKGRKEARSDAESLLQENATIFEVYGPMGEERLNPESELPEKWIRKVRTIILPNNRKILAIIDCNKHLLTTEERKIVEVFRQHVDDFELKHIGGSDISGIRFPSELQLIFGDRNE